MKSSSGSRYHLIENRGIPDGLFLRIDIKEGNLRSNILGSLSVFNRDYRLAWLVKSINGLSSLSAVFINIWTIGSGILNLSLLISIDFDSISLGFF